MSDTPRQHKDLKLLASELRAATRRPLGAVFRDPRLEDEKTFRILARVASKLEADLWRNNRTLALLSVVRRAVRHLPDQEYPEDERKTWRSEIAWREVGELLCGFRIEELPLREDGGLHTYNDCYDELVRRSGLQAVRERSFRDQVTGRFRQMLAGILLRMEDGSIPDEEGSATAQHALKSVDLRPAGQVPRDLVSDVPDFVGRGDYIEELNAVLHESGQQPTAVVISALSGTPGAGKTALAVHWAHRVRNRFPDGDLYVDLRGYAPGEPMEPQEALVRLLRRLGVDQADIPNTLDERAACYRTELTSRRMLIVLDNARSAQQVEPLLPGGGTCFVVVTSRETLSVLRELRGARLIQLDPFPPDEALALLQKLVGSRVNDERDAACEIAAACSHLPLALRIAAGVALDRPDDTLTSLSEELAAERLLEMSDESDDPRLSLRAVFSWSYKSLTQRAAALFRAFGLLPGEDAGVHTMTAALDIEENDAEQRLRALRRASLIEEPRPARYKMHDLLRVYAGEAAKTEWSADERAAIVDRVLGYCLYTANTAMNTLYPRERQRRPEVLPVATPLPDVSLREAAREWIDVERINLIAAAVSAANNGKYVVDFSGVLHRDLEVTGYYEEAITVHQAAREHARQLGDRLMEGSACTRLGVMYWRLDDYSRAADAFQSAIDACHDDMSARALSVRMAALGNLSLVHAQQENWQEAILLSEQALEISETLNDSLGVAFGLTNIGTCHLGSGDPQAALPFLRRALKVHRESLNPNGVAIALGSLGECYIDLGMHKRGEHRLRRALAIHRSTGDKEGEGRALETIAKALRHQGQSTTALDYASQALEIHKVLKNRKHQASAAVTLGSVLNDLGQPESAMETLEAALILAGNLRDPILLGDAEVALGDSFSLKGQLLQAQSKWREAFELYARVNTTRRREQIRARLLQRLSES